MDTQAILKVLTEAKVGDTIKMRFKPGDGKKGTLTQDERVSFIRFVALAGLMDAETRRFKFGQTDLSESIAAMNLMAVAQSGYWDMVPKQFAATLVQPVTEEDASFYARRIGDVLDEFTLVPAA